MTTKRTLAVMQPTYLPWAGYFDLMAQADVFVLLDDAQFVKQSWHQRNRVKSPKGLEWLTIPVKLAGRFGQPINAVEVAEIGFAVKHLKTVEQNYRKAPYFSDTFAGLRGCYERAASRYLAALNGEVIRWLAAAFGVETSVFLASGSGIGGVRSARLVDLCRHFGATDYLSPLGAAEYLLADLGLFEAAGLGVTFQHYDHPTYPQLYPPFVPFASGLDVLFNTGPAAGDVIRSGRRPPLTPAEVRSKLAATPEGPRDG